MPRDQPGAGRRDGECRRVGDFDHPFQGQAPGDRGRFVGRLTDLVAADTGFLRLGVEQQALRERPIASRVIDAEAAKRAVEMSDAELQEMFGLQNRNRAGSFRPMLCEGLQRL
jgi:hypothetical protein